MNFTRSRNVFDDMQAFHASCPLVGKTVAGGASVLLATTIVGSAGAVLAISFTMATLAAIAKHSDATIMSKLCDEEKLQRFRRGLKDALLYECESSLLDLSTPTQKNIVEMAAKLNILSEDDLYTSRQSDVLLSVYVRAVDQWTIRYDTKTNI